MHLWSENQLLSLKLKPKKNNKSFSIVLKLVTVDIFPFLHNEPHLHLPIFVIDKELFVTPITRIGQSPGKKVQSLFLRSPNTSEDGPAAAALYEGRSGVEGEEWGLVGSTIDCHCCL